MGKLLTLIAITGMTFGFLSFTQESTVQQLAKAGYGAVAVQVASR